MTRRLIMLRHGQTDYNATRRMQGHLNTKLSPVGFEQAAAAADFLTNKNIIKIVSSDLDRAFDTATVIGQRLNLPVEKDERLRETHLGLWQSRSHDEVDQLYPGMRALSRHDATWAPPRGGSCAAVSAGVVNGVPLLDLDYPEDSGCDSDVNIVMLNAENIIEIQGTAEGAPFSLDELGKLIALAQKGIAELTAHQQNALSS